MEIFDEEITITPNSDRPIHPANEGWHTCGGLTKREYFAAMAMQGLLANKYIGGNGHPCEGISKMAKNYADALLTQLSSPTSSGE